MKRGLILLALLLCTISVGAQEGSITLLAQAQNETGDYGTTARLSLQIEPGRERVFLETFPLSKVTTQASLRFAQQIACAELDRECRGYDFFWRISGVNGIVGGPSAGASAALLASAVLMNETVPEDVTVTGTINSGGSIGPVAGLENKIRAAKKRGIGLVFIAPGSFLGNDTSIQNLSREIGIFIEEAPTLRYILEKVFDVQYNDTALIRNSEYESRMKDVAAGLCARAHSLMDNATGSAGANLTQMAAKNMEEGNHYSAASFCFRAAVALRSRLYLNSSVEYRKSRLAALESEISQVKGELDEVSLDTITNLQTYMAVRERVDESEILLSEIKNLSGKKGAVSLGYAEERFHSALAWSAFFDVDGENISIDVSSIRQCCISKLEEAHERFNYVLTLVSENLGSTQKELSRAERYLSEENYVMCVYSASKAKALSNFLMDLVGTRSEFLNSTAALKLDIAEQSIADSMAKGIFPIMAYSYLEYARSLQEKEILNSLMFAEEALELSSFDIYFKRPFVAPVPSSEWPDLMTGFIVGIIVGAGLAFVVLRKSRN